MKRGSSQSRLIKKIKIALLSASPKFELDYLKIKHPILFDVCVAAVLNEFGRKQMLNLDGTFKPDLRKRGTG